MKKIVYVSALVLCVMSVSCKKQVQPTPVPPTPPVYPVDSLDCKPWMDFVNQTEDNVLLDFSYAGYWRGEKPVPEVGDRTRTFTVYNVCDYGAVPDDGKSDREAFLACLTDIFGKPTFNPTALVFPKKPQANAIVYFPEGTYILHTEEDNGKAYPDTGVKYNDMSQCITIQAGNFVIRGAGRDKTRLEMVAPGYPGEVAELWDGVYMLSIATTSPETTYVPEVTPVEDSPKGSHYIKVNSTFGVSAGDWVALVLDKYIDEEYVRRELCGLEPLSNEWQILGNDPKVSGVCIYDMHQVKSVRDNVIEVYAPLMHEIDATAPFKIRKLDIFENAGVEDLSFIAHTLENYKHHANYLYDSGWQVLKMEYLANSWVRRVDFQDVTGGVNINYCANCSAYDMVFRGLRGHSTCNSMNSSRIFIGATLDVTNGLGGGYNPDHAPTDIIDKAGMIHAVGINKLSMGAVIWKNRWGDDSCFESHSKQPRATLLDANRGGWLMGRYGGDTKYQPAHLQDLVVWNMDNSLSSSPEFTFYGMYQTLYMSFIQPIVIGYHGGPCTFKEDECKYIYNNGAPVGPTSLYEAQLKRRLGYLPGWLMELDAVANRYLSEY